MQPILSTQGLSVARGNTVLTDNVTRSIKPGEVLLLLGPNGSGKTSFLRTLAGLLEPAAGTIICDHLFHWIPAQALNPSLETPRQYLTYQAALMDAPFNIQNDPFNIKSVLDTPLNRLSTGWRQRVKLSRLILDQYPIWFLDEPADGLDSIALKILQNLIAAHAKAGGAIIIATHDAHLWPDASRMEFGGAA